MVVEFRPLARSVVGDVGAPLLKLAYKYHFRGGVVRQLTSCRPYRGTSGARGISEVILK